MMGNETSFTSGMVMAENERRFTAERVYIAGAHSRAQTLAVYLQYLYPVTVEAFLYDNDEKNPAWIGRTAVLRMTEAPMGSNTEMSIVNLHTEYPVYIATRGIYHERLAKKLKRIGFSEIYPLTVDLDIYLRNKYLKKYFSDIGREFIKIDGLGRRRKTMLPEKNLSTAIYVVKSIYDAPLRKEYRLAPYEREIQAGAELAKERLSAEILTDHRGEHISGRNRQFCELTAVYWLWKHAEEDIVGLAHYRRHFILPDDWAERMCENGIDVILPVPLFVAPSLEGNYKKRHGSYEWEAMLRYLQEKDEKEYQAAKEFFGRNNLYSPCNMFIMKKAVMDELCGWLFPLLFDVAERCGQKRDGYLNRYPGFLSERLITFFFERNRKRFRIAYSDKNFLESDGRGSDCEI